MRHAANLGATAVTFDLWQTLIFEFDGSAISVKRRKLRSEYVAEILAEAGEPVDPADIGPLFLQLSAEITAGHDRGIDSRFDVWVGRLMELIGPGMAARIGAAGLDAVGQVIDRAFIDSPPNLLDGVLELLDLLSDRGIKIGLISNTGLTSPSAYRQWFSQVELLDKFDQISLSNELEIAKPTARIFDVTVGALGVAASSVLHVGDNMHTDVAGAAEAGLATVWVRGGIKSPLKTSHRPDYTVDSVLELMPVIDDWLTTLDG